LEGLGLDELYLGSYRDLDREKVEQTCDRVLAEDENWRIKIQQACRLSRNLIQEVFEQKLKLVTR